MEIKFEKVDSENLDLVNQMYPGDEGKYWIDFNWYWVEITKRRQDVECYLISYGQENTPIGFIAYGQHYSDRFLKLKVDSKAEIYHTVIYADFQQQGLGRAITELVVQKLLQDKNYSDVVIAANPENISASKLYTSLGFTKFSTNYDDDPLYGIKSISLSDINLPENLESLAGKVVPSEKRDQWYKESIECSEDFNWDHWENEIEDED